MMHRRSLLLGSAAIFGCASENNKFSFEIKYKDSKKLLKNPGTGNIIYYYANSFKYYKEDIDKYSDEYLFGINWASIMYFRLPWSSIEKSDGEYDWDVIDVPMNRYKKYGFRFAIRVTTSENDPKIKFATPEWVFAHGANYNRFTGTYPGKFDKGGSNFEPVFGDRVFLFYLKRFLTEFSKRYDGDPLIDFIDIGSLGVYGEGHTVSSTQVGYTRDVLLEHFYMHTGLFKKTKLIVNHNFADRDPKNGRDIDVMRILSQDNVGFRDDSILIGRGARAYYDNNMAKLFNKKNPVILEMGEYSTRISSGAWDVARLMESIGAYGASYFGLYWYPKKFYEIEKNLINEICRIVGYRIIIDSIKFTSELFSSGKFRMLFSVRNAGSSIFYFNLRLNVYFELSGVKFLIGSSVVGGDFFVPGTGVYVSVECAGVDAKSGALLVEFVDDNGRIISLPHDESRSGGAIDVDFRSARKIGY